MTDYAPPGCTPDCEVCGAQIELLEESVVLFQGQFMWLKEEQYAPMLLEPETNFEVISFEVPKLPPRKALVVDPASLGDLRVVHKQCLEELLGDSDEDDDEDEDEDLDAQMLRAIENDVDYDEYGNPHGDPNHDPYWERR